MAVIIILSRRFYWVKVSNSSEFKSSLNSIKFKLGRLPNWNAKHDYKVLEELPQQIQSRHNSCWFRRLVRHCQEHYFPFS